MPLVCTDCQLGHHHHDTYGPYAIEVSHGLVAIGDIADCPNAVQGRDCLCEWRGPGKTAHPLTVRHCPTCRCGGDS